PPLLLARLTCTLRQDPAPPETPPLSLHDALPISMTPRRMSLTASRLLAATAVATMLLLLAMPASSLATTLTPSPATTCVPTVSSDRKSTRLNSSHVKISYAVFCLKKKKQRRKRAH